MSRFVKKHSSSSNAESTKKKKQRNHYIVATSNTKFSPDCYFGLLKQGLRRTDVSSLSDIVNVVNQCSYVNSAQLVGTHEAEILLIKQKHHFNINSNDVQIYIKETSTSNSTTINLLRSHDVIPPKETLPEQLYPKGVSAERQWYLYDKIRQYCAEDSKNKTCPLPDIPRPSTLCQRPEQCSTRPQTFTVQPPRSSSKSSKKCGKCSQVGHNRRSYKQ